MLTRIRSRRRSCVKIFRLQGFRVVTRVGGARAGQFSAEPELEPVLQKYFIEARSEPEPVDIPGPESEPEPFKIFPGPHPCRNRKSTNILRDYSSLRRRISVSVETITLSHKIPKLLL